MRYRVIYIGLGGLAIAIAALGFVFASEGGVTELPPPIEEVFPLPNNSVIRQTTIEVDLEIGHEAIIYVDGFAIPENELAYSDATGVYRWSPGPTSLIMSAWEPGDHTASASSGCVSPAHHYAVSSSGRSGCSDL